MCEWSLHEFTCTISVDVDANGKLLLASMEFNSFSVVRNGSGREKWDSSHYFRSAYTHTSSYEMMHNRIFNSSYIARAIFSQFFPPSIMLSLSSSLLHSLTFLPTKIFSLDGILQWIQHANRTHFGARISLRQPVDNSIILFHFSYQKIWHTYSFVD